MIVLHDLSVDELLNLVKRGCKYKDIQSEGFTFNGAYLFMCIFDNYDEYKKAYKILEKDTKPKKKLCGWL